MCKSPYDFLTKDGGTLRSPELLDETGLMILNKRKAKIVGTVLFLSNGYVSRMNHKQLLMMYCCMNPYAMMLKRSSLTSVKLANSERYYGICTSRLNVE